ncbi:MAG: hypothetical protein V1775_00505 [Bacteroidota bacterium]
MKKPEIKKDRKLTNLEVLQLYADLKNLKSIPGLKLNYAISRTIQNLKPLTEAFDQEKLIPKSELFKKYEEELRKAYETIASGGSGRPKTRIVQIPTGEFETLDIDINGDEAKQSRAEMQEEYSGAIEERKTDVREYTAWLNQECEDEFRIFMIRLSEMPDSGTEDYKQLWDVCGVMVLEEASETC